ncbi:argininosuccinate lyase [Candidatus Daviesbacteria bacterium RIFCSPLOWO2_01_FULL_38_10]|uniref:Argininosuccinate lyase n=1 Tax=Candidatus Daviesbacteria bacterium GW2011_GWF2_38_6 TaxID=1618432 RepID=A0A0G0KTU7_9BACT|nr:MAG: Argininosuccinate lyase [Candidatus Daviesbacteria bacterium GW2011_GWA2_38_17]KKQ78970.1 MAG: Argininosuccinate lyase [Candidatus Daviesbacteria bacterium GW2011_GWF2_38_6]OGE27860.1 MAG: argininosuccinate lyase [Candidatus Daviesbacteria bacterium RIFCSPHIGHO2_02_FULL_39_41]OGE27936.1 MAG: argininosuccinate lyase [Candidatus Daviesbacteria bacterium RIFCSPHIGHO2_01_FULL_38_8b]OGE38970.1 MAG: argininosuccinate lyase [Candidatus Daviesbacteria bacterium RIFCSPLOWO2_01_FULL_38_10]OGE450
MKKLWEKDKTKLDPVIEAFETKEDLLMDQKLVKYDCLGSLAHAKMLCKIGILSKSELAKLEKGLLEILSLDKQGKFLLKIGDEDMHTKIENFLTEKYGEVGQKIHTGRSRNDQVLTAIRLYSKEMMENIKQDLAGLIKSFENFSKKYGSIKMPGYTHMQKAMPSSIRLWAGSFMDSLKDDSLMLNTAIKLNNQSPLGSAAGYGIPLKLDREYTAKLLGFAKVQNNPLYCQNSKGKIEAVILAALTQILLTINKFASDIMLFTTSEFNFFQASDKVTTGSSMMPQKKNPDAAELLRSKVHLILGNYIALVSLSSNLPSGYNRDLQDIKKPLLESLEITLGSLEVTKILLENLTPNKEVLKKSMTEEIFAAQKAYELVQKGMPFRKAYREVK